MFCFIRYLIVKHVLYLVINNVITCFTEPKKTDSILMITVCNKQYSHIPIFAYFYTHAANLRQHMTKFWNNCVMNLMT